MLNLFFSNYIFINDFFFFLPELFLIYSILFGLVLLLVLSSILFLPFISTLLFCIFVLLLFFFLLVTRPVYNFTIFNFCLVYNNFSAFAFLIATLLLCSALIFSLDYCGNCVFSLEFFFILLCCFFGLLLLLVSNDFIVFIVCLEIYSLMSYALACSNLYSFFSTEAGLKYLIMGSFSSSLMLLGLLFIYLFSGVSSFNDLYTFVFLDCFNRYSFSFVFFLGFFFIFVSLFFKMGLAPFHFWLPDVYSGVSFPVLIFFSTVINLVVCFLFFNLVFLFLSFLPVFFDYFFLLVALLSLLVGTFSAISQTKMKKLLAYSSVANLSFFVVCFFVFSFINIWAALFFLCGYTFVLLCFIAFASFAFEWSVEKFFVSVLSFSGLFVFNSFFSLLGFVFLMSITGIPPLFGFFVNFFVLLGLISNFNTFFVAALFLIFTVLSAFYYFRVVNVIFFESFFDVSWFFLCPFSYPSIFLLVFFFFLNVFMCFFMPPIFDFITLSCGSVLKF